MIKILFVCHGNICRSPMAEYMMKDMVKYRQLEDKYYIDSAAVSDESVGQSMHEGAKAKLDAVGVPYEDRKARKMTMDDYKEFDYIIGMEKQDIDELNALFDNDPDGKAYRLFEFAGKDKDIPNPWVTNDFDDAYDDILVGLSGLLKKLQQN